MSGNQRKCDSLPNHALLDQAALLRGPGVSAAAQPWEARGGARRADTMQLPQIKQLIHNPCTWAVFLGFHCPDRGHCF
jgi:hypothetical protein